MKERNTESGRMLRECEVLATICGWWSIGQLGGEKAKKFIFRSIGTSFYSVQYGKYLLALGIQTTNIQQQRTNRKRRGEFVLSVVEALPARQNMDDAITTLASYNVLYSTRSIHIRSNEFP